MCNLLNAFRAILNSQRYSVNVFSNIVVNVSTKTFVIFIVALSIRVSIFHASAHKLIKFCHYFICRAPIIPGTKHYIVPDVSYI